MNENKNNAARNEIGGGTNCTIPSSSRTNWSFQSDYAYPPHPPHPPTPPPHHQPHPHPHPTPTPPTVDMCAVMYGLDSEDDKKFNVLETFFQKLKFLYKVER